MKRFLHTLVFAGALGLLVGHAVWSDQVVVSRYVGTLVPALTTFSAGLKTGRVTTGTTGVATCSSTGLGTGSAAVAAGSTDFAGTCVLSPTGAPAATGTVTVTFSAAYGSNRAVCVAMLARNTAQWDARATLRGQTTGSATYAIIWDNNAVALAAGSVYDVDYVCVGR